MKTACPKNQKKTDNQQMSAGHIRHKKHLYIILHVISRKFNKNPLL